MILLNTCHLLEIIFNGANKQLQLKPGKLEEKIMVQNELTVQSTYFFHVTQFIYGIFIKICTFCSLSRKNIDYFDRSYMKLLNEI